MKKVTLKEVPNGNSFTFGNVQFEKAFESDLESDLLGACKISGTDAIVYIPDHTEVDIDE